MVDNVWDFHSLKGLKRYRKKRDENTINDIAEKLELVSNTYMVTKEELSHNFVAKDVSKNRMITVAGQIFFEKEKKLHYSNQISKGYEKYIGDERHKKIY